LYNKFFLYFNCVIFLICPKINKLDWRKNTFKKTAPYITIFTVLFCQKSRKTLKFPKKKQIWSFTTSFCLFSRLSQPSSKTLQKWQFWQKWPKMTNLGTFLTINGSFSLKFDFLTLWLNFLKTLGIFVKIWGGYLFWFCL